MNEKEVAITLPLWILASVYLGWVFSQFNLALQVVVQSVVWGVWGMLILVDFIEGKSHVDFVDHSSGSKRSN